jgi:hypothetical protein
MNPEEKFNLALNHSIVLCGVDLSCKQRWAELVGFLIDLNSESDVTAILNELRKHLNTKALKADSNNPNDPALYE